MGEGVRKKGLARIPRLWEESMLWAGPWDNHVLLGVGQGSQASEVEQGAKGNSGIWWWSRFVLERRKDSFSIYLSVCSWIPGAFGGICSNVNSRKSWIPSLWAGTLDCKASLGTVGFLWGRGAHWASRGPTQKKAGSVNHARSFLGGALWAISSVREIRAFAI